LAAELDLQKTNHDIPDGALLLQKPGTGLRGSRFEQMERIIIALLMLHLENQNFPKAKSMFQTLLFVEIFRNYI
jgi:hypothetical protein